MCTYIPVISNLSDLLIVFMQLYSKKITINKMKPLTTPPSFYTLLPELEKHRGTSKCLTHFKMCMKTCRCVII